MLLKALCGHPDRAVRRGAKRLPPPPFTRPGGKVASPAPGSIRSRGNLRRTAMPRYGIFNLRTGRKLLSANLRLYMCNRYGEKESLRVAAVWSVWRCAGSPARPRAKRLAGNCSPFPFFRKRGKAPSVDFLSCGRCRK